MNIIKKYIDKCLELSELHKEYLSYFDDSSVIIEMQEDLDLNKFSEKPDSVFIKQGENEINIYKCDNKDTVWKAIENNVSDEEIQYFENELNIVLPQSYKDYLKYKHHYEIFWDIEVVLYAKPKLDWSSILITENEEMREFVLEKGYLSIGKYSDYGIIGLKLSNNKNDEFEVCLIDCEENSFTRLANNFRELLHQIIELEQPTIENLKDWQTKMTIYKR